MKKFLAVMTIAIAAIVAMVSSAHARDGRSVTNGSVCSGVAVQGVRAMPTYSIWVRISTRTGLPGGPCLGILCEFMAGSTCMGWTMAVGCNGDPTIHYFSGDGCYDVAATSVPLGDVSVNGGAHNGVAVNFIENGVERVEVPFYADDDNRLVAKLVVDQYNHQTLLTGSQLQ